jgi:hypothetical protein
MEVLGAVELRAVQVKTKTVVAEMLKVVAEPVG